MNPSYMTYDQICNNLDDRETMSYEREQHLTTLREWHEQKTLNSGDPSNNISDENAFVAEYLSRYAQERRLQLRATGYLKDRHEKQEAKYNQGDYIKDIDIAVDAYHMYLTNCNTVSTVLPVSGAEIVIGAHFIRPVEIEIIFKPNSSTQISGQLKNENDLRDFLKRRLTTF